ncbi:hypothetical protein, partial [Sedimentibacter sp. B4]|uniref:hypothetical protein n=1 Tax=Sedimentibacter sp. B4 TaxID=304766 RepID=UPI00058B31C2
IDVLAVHPATRSIIAVEAKDFEVARTPAEIASELEKLFAGKGEKKATIELHSDASTGCASTTKSHPVPWPR